MNGETTSARRRVVVAMSGGVDSSAAAALLLEAGHQCFGVFMVTNDRSRHAQSIAEAVARKLGIELDVLDLRGDFEPILDYFCNEYGRGRTPNPCVLCNRLIKFGTIWDFARQKGADAIATGHYARVRKDDRAGLYQSADPAKDQSYVLAMVRPEVLNHVMLPLGTHTKGQARAIAARLDLGIEHRAESQEICFIPDDDHVAVLERRCPSLLREGAIVDTAGTELGKHRGVHRYTIGQRRGLGVAMGLPHYVTRLDPETNTVILGPKEQVMSRRLTATSINWLAEPATRPFRATVKIRYNDRGHAATVVPAGDTLDVRFDEAVSAVTPGQLAVAYVDAEPAARVVAAGWIDRVGTAHRRGRTDEPEASPPTIA
jgi:tRNA-specific 2-thiouridylase